MSWTLARAPRSPVGRPRSPIWILHRAAGPDRDALPGSSRPRGAAAHRGSDLPPDRPAASAAASEFAIKDCHARPAQGHGADPRRRRTIPPDALKQVRLAQALDHAPLTTATRLAPTTTAPPPSPRSRRRSPRLASTVFTSSSTSGTGTSTGARLRDLLAEKARAGVAVRVIVDGVGAKANRREVHRAAHGGRRTVRAVQSSPGSLIRSRWPQLPHSPQDRRRRRPGRLHRRHERLRFADGGTRRRSRPGGTRCSSSKAGS